MYLRLQRTRREGSNVSLTVSWWDEYTRLSGKEPWAKADLPRLALIGELEDISDEDVKEQGVVECFQKVHRDSRLWTPGRKGAAHGGKWARVRGGGGVLDWWVWG